MNHEFILWLGSCALVLCIIGMLVKWLRPGVSLVKAGWAWVISVLICRVAFPDEPVSVVIPRGVYCGSLFLFLCLLTIPADLNPRAKPNLVRRILGK